MSGNKEAVAKYHSKLKDMKIRFLKADAELGIPDYAATIQQQAKLLGKSANEYILDLVEDDIRSNQAGLNITDFTIIRSAKDLK